MDAILRHLMKDLGHAELLAMYLVYMRRLAISGAAEVVHIRQGEMRVCERKLRDKIFPCLKLDEARTAVATLYEMLPHDQRDGLVRYMVNRMPPGSVSTIELLAFHRS